MPKTVTIPLVNGVAGETHVDVGDQVQWTATELSFVIPPDLFADNCKSLIVVPGDGKPAPSKPCHVTGKHGRYPYTCGVGAAAADPYPHRVGSGSDVIIIDTGKPKP